MATAFNIAIDGLSVPDKLILMERLWADLSQQPANIPSPAWHGEILAQRLESVRKGEATFTDWDDAKQRLRKRLQ